MSVKTVTPKGLIVTAHPDDSFIFAYYIRQMNPHIEWHDAVATYDERTARGKEFIEAARLMHSKPYCIGLEDKYQHGLDVNKLDKEITKLFKDIRPHFVITHNSVGEYGHRHHTDVHHTVKACMMGLKTAALLTFSHSKAPPDLIYVGTSKPKSPVMKVYERELYMIGNFDPHLESFIIERDGALVKKTLGIPGTYGRPFVEVEGSWNAEPKAV